MLIQWRIAACASSPARNPRRSARAGASPSRQTSPGSQLLGLPSQSQPSSVQPPVSASDDSPMDYQESLRRECQARVVEAVLAADFTKEDGDDVYTTAEQLGASPTCSGWIVGYTSASMTKATPGPVVGAFLGAAATYARWCGGPIATDLEAAIRSRDLPGLRSLLERWAAGTRPVWALPDRLDPGQSTVLAVMCLFHVVGGMLFATLTNALTFAAADLGDGSAGEQSVVLAVARVGVVLTIATMAFADRAGRRDDHQTPEPEIRWSTRPCDAPRSLPWR